MSEIDEFAINLVEQAQHVGDMSREEAQYIIGFLSA